ncbi:PQQ-binding-like beta-propeller repeat protein [Streptomyces lanatus]|uniref:PQQ-binding-like beta-propeller repeat protein n=1 Tax=Streptomyces lanatus TaxID=66900 RepID=A0ABV1Y2F8_9ACTN|nr:PQQ-binding-like beta-propeller repeat protein [Streptomyces lanatus]
MATASLVALLVSDAGTSGRPLERPNTLDVAWSLRTSGRALDVSEQPAVVGDRLLAIPQGGKVAMVDTRDGRFLSTARSSADRFSPVGFSGGVMLAVEEWFGQNTKAVLNAYDPATGRKLWHKAASSTPREGEEDSWLGQPPFLLESGPVTQLSDGRLVGLVPRTGAVRWSRPTPELPPCERSGADDITPPASPLNAAAAAQHIALLRGCPGETAEIEVVNGEDGRSVWKRSMGRVRESVGVSAAGGVIGVGLDHDVRLFAASGKEIPRRGADSKSGLWPVGEADGVVYLSEGHPGVPADAGSLQSRTVHAVREDTGRTLWKRPQGPQAPSSVTGEAIITEAYVAGAYGGDLRWSPGDARLQGPGASSLRDFAGRQSATVPWPVAGTYVGSSGDLLIVRSEEKDGTRYTALRPGHRTADAERPVALGGVERRDWPNACGLVSDDFLAELGENYVKLPVKASRKVMGTKLPSPSVCRYATESGSDDGIFSVTVRWVATDEAAAETYATSVLPWGCDPALGGCVTARITQPQRGVHLYTYRTGLQQLPVAHATVVSGRYVFGVSAGNDKTRTKQLIRRLATHLTERSWDATDTASSPLRASTSP